MQGSKRAIAACTQVIDTANTMKVRVGLDLAVDSGRWDGTDSFINAVLESCLGGSLLELLIAWTVSAATNACDGFIISSTPSSMDYLFNILIGLAHTNRGKQAVRL